MTVVNAAAQPQSFADKAKDNFIGTTDDFLKILQAQLKHQDPLSPMEGTEFIDSITRLSSVEQNINQNKYLEDMLNLMKDEQSQLGSPVTYLGRRVEIESALFHLTEGYAEISYTLEEKSGDVLVTIKDEDGKTVFTGKGSNEIGKNVVFWDGKDLNGNQLENGTYSVSVTMPDPENPSDFVDVPTHTSLLVTEADFTGFEPVLRSGDIEFPMGAVRSIRVGGI